MTTYTVTDTPTTGDLVVGCTTVTSNDAATQLTKLGDQAYRVERVNHHTGRATVRTLAGGKAVQVVRGRWGWSLANGTALPIRFATEQATPAPVAPKTTPAVPASKPRQVVTAPVVPAPHPAAVCAGTGTCWCNTPTTPAAPPVAPQQTAPAPAHPRGRSGERTVLLAVVWALVALLTVVGAVATFYARMPLAVAKGARMARTHLCTWIAAQRTPAP